MQHHTIIAVCAVSFTLSACSKTTKEDPPQPTQRTWTLESAQAPPDAEDIDPAPNIVHVRLRPEAMIDPEGHTVYGYNGLRPGPTIRARVGDTIRVDLINALDTPTTIHWHGLKVPFEMDGVVWRGSPVDPEGSFTYEFQVESSGTFWYHPHFDTSRQVDLGLYGALIVEAPDEPSVDREMTLILDTPDEFGTPSTQHGHAQRNRMWTVNGHHNPTYTFQPGETVRMRLVNASNHGYVDLSSGSTQGALTLIAQDQGVLSGAPHNRDRVLLSPGDRAELVWSVGDTPPTLFTTPYTLNGGPTLGEPMPLFTPTLEGPPTPPPSPRTWSTQPTQPPTPDPPHTDIMYVFSGSDRTGRWLINAEQFPNISVREVPFGSVQIVEVRNLSPTEHPFHLHGLHFEVLSINGNPPEVQQIEDTINLPIRSTVRLRVLADNTGDWMTHCHILPHAESGMMTVLRVLEP